MEFSIHRVFYSVCNGLFRFCRSMLLLIFPFHKLVSNKRKMLNINGNFGEIFRNDPFIQNGTNSPTSVELLLTIPVMFTTDSSLRESREAVNNRIFPQKAASISLDKRLSKPLQHLISGNFQGYFRGVFCRSFALIQKNNSNATGPY